MVGLMAYGGACVLLEATTAVSGMIALSMISAILGYIVVVVTFSGKIRTIPRSER
jgi:hypothetical protein